MEKDELVYTKKENHAETLDLCNDILRAVQKHNLPLEDAIAGISWALGSILEAAFGTDEEHIKRTADSILSHVQKNAKEWADLRKKRSN